MSEPNTARMCTTCWQPWEPGHVCYGKQFSYPQTKPAPGGSLYGRNLTEQPKQCIHDRWKDQCVQCSPKVEQESFRGKLSKPYKGEAKPAVGSLYGRNLNEQEGGKAELCGVCGDSDCKTPTNNPQEHCLPNCQCASKVEQEGGKAKPMQHSPYCLQGQKCPICDGEAKPEAPAPQPEPKEWATAAAKEIRDILTCSPTTNPKRAWLYSVRVLPRIAAIIERHSQIRGEAPAPQPEKVQYDAKFHAFMLVNRVVEKLVPLGAQLTKEQADSVHQCAKDLARDLTSGEFVFVERESQPSRSIEDIAKECAEEVVADVFPSMDSACSVRYVEQATKIILRYAKEQRL